MQYWQGSMGRKYQSIVETIGNTPVVRINRLAPPGERKDFACFLTPAIAIEHASFR
jgi:hypothetical protein